MEIFASEFSSTSSCFTKAKRICAAGIVSSLRTVALRLLLMHTLAFVQHFVILNSAYYSSKTVKHKIIRNKNNRVRILFDNGDTV